jgi:hypothetical protein
MDSYFQVGYTKFKLESLNPAKFGPSLAADGSVSSTIHDVNKTEHKNNIYLIVFIFFFLN